MKVTQYITIQHDQLNPDKPQGMELFPHRLKPMGDYLANARTIKIDEAPQRNRYNGVGVAITGSSCYELNTMQPEKRRAFLEKIYGKDGLNLNVGRVSVGSSDYSAEVYTYDDVPGDVGLEHFSVERDQDYILPMIREVLAVNPDIDLFASPWSPPGWMKTGGCIAGGHMRDRYVEQYAEYFVKFLKAYEENGVHIGAVTPQNEPETDQHGLMPACRWNPDTEAKFISILYHKLREAGLETKIWMFDHCFEGWNRVRWMLQEYPELLEQCDALAFHYYADAIERLEGITEQFPNVMFEFTEGGPRLYDHYATDVCKWGTMIAKAFNHGCRSFTGWNLMLDENGGPNIGPFFCGGLATLHSQTGEITYSGQYKALAHYARFVKRGATVHASHVINDGQEIFKYGSETFSPVETCAFCNPDGTRVLVIVNPNKFKRQMQIKQGGEWWYIEMLPESVSTVIFEKDGQDL